MADDASGTDGDDGRREPSAESDVQNTEAERGRAGESDAPDRSARTDPDDPPRDGRGPRREGAGRDNASDDEYRIPLDLSNDADEVETADAADAADESDDPYAPEPSSAPIEPGQPELENVLFVFLGAIAMGLVLFRIVAVPF